MAMSTGSLQWPRLRMRIGLVVAAVLMVPAMAVATVQTGGTESSTPFSHAWLRDYAQSLSDQPYKAQALSDRNPLRDLTYDQYRRIVFDPAAAIWRDLPTLFQLQLFHPGFLHTTPVSIHLVENGMARRLAFAPERFTYEGSGVDPDDALASGYAGFRIHHPINTAERFEEFLVFLGASYFRGVGKNQFYGLSARGLALNTVGPGREEFPRFSEFWVERPTARNEIVVYALLESPSVTGAYRFTVWPGEQTRMDVDASLYPRSESPRVGVAPLTSMFMFDATNRGSFNDYRASVHDSEGLSILQQNGERVWRPLANPNRLQVSAFGAQQATPTGFGLMQRHRSFAQFNDYEARYDKRPSLWIQPRGDWGPGHVELVEIPTNVEYNDNIVAYWRPAGGFQAGETYRFRYTMVWGQGAPGASEIGQIVDTSAGAALDNDDLVFVIDYRDGGTLPSIATNPEAVEIAATASAGRITGVSGTLVEPTGHYRAYIRFDSGEASLSELRVTLQVNGQQWGETWLYRWSQ